MSKLRLGLTLFIVFFVLNAVLMKLGIGGLLREFTRLGTLIGLLMSVFFGIARLVQKKHGPGK